MDALIKNSDKMPETSVAFNTLCSLTHASESMKHELHSLFLYLASCGENPEDFVCDFLKRQTVFRFPEEATPSGDASDKQAGIQPGLKSENNSDLPDFQNITLKKPDARRLFTDFREAVKLVLPDVAGTTASLITTGGTKSPVHGKSFFGKIYVEDRALTYSLTERILAAFPGSETEHIVHYKDIFNVGGQDFVAQKKEPALILAVNDGRRLYPGARPCQDFGHTDFVYTSQVKNCLYDCEYCFLRGMYPSGNIVVFVNLEDYFGDVDRELKEHPVYLSIAYDTDLLALEGITGICESWAVFAAKRPNLLLEIRTKCGSTGFLQKLSEPNIILAYTISPPAVSETFEHGAGSYEARKKALYFALSKGLRTRLCIDPALAVKDFKKLYGEMIDDLFSDPKAKRLEDISIGSFRISGSYIKKMKKTALTPVSAYPYSLKDGICGYDEALRTKMLDFLENRIAKFYPKEKIFRAAF